MTLRSNLVLSSRIGGGHFGEVYLADDAVHGDVAVKVFTQYPGESDIAWQARKANLLQEGQYLSLAQHRNVVKVHHLLEEEARDVVLLIMELCAEGSLQQAFDNGPMRLSHVRKHATETALGLEVLHARGMLHRDIKPANLLVHNGVTKLGDFGLVTDDLILGYGSQAGYLDHIAPEVRAGAGTSAKSDVWALGMTIYRLLHGADWYSKLPDPRNIIPNGGFADSLPWLPHIPKPWRRVIRCMLKDDPAARFQNANQVLSGLAQLPTYDWDCVVGSTGIQWQREVNERLIKVLLQFHSSRKHEWMAWSEPVGKGRHRSLAGSGGLVSPSSADKSLKKFFAKTM